MNEVADFIGGFAFKSDYLKEFASQDTDLPVIKIGNLSKDGTLDLQDVQYYTFTDSLEKFMIKQNDILIAMTGATVGKVACSDRGNILLNQRVGIIRAKDNKISQEFLKSVLLSDKFYKYCQKTAGGGAQGNISPTKIMEYKIPLCSKEDQGRIISVFNKERMAISSNEQLIDVFESKIKEKIAEVWGE